MIRAFATDTHLKNNLYASYNALDLLNLKEVLDLACPTYTLPDLVNLSWGSLSCNREAESQVLQVGEHSLLSRHQHWNFHFCWNKKSLTNSNLGEKGFFLVTIPGSPPLLWRSQGSSSQSQSKAGSNERMHAQGLRTFPQSGSSQGMIISSSGLGLPISTKPKKNPSQAYSEADQTWTHETLFPGDTRVCQVGDQSYHMINVQRTVGDGCSLFLYSLFSRGASITMCVYEVCCMFERGRDTWCDNVEFPLVNASNLGGCL